MATLGKLGEGYKNVFCILLQFGRVNLKLFQNQELKQKFFNFLKKEIWIIDPHPRGSDSGGLEWVSRICTLTKFSGDEDVAPFENPCTVVQLLLSQACHTLKTTTHSFIMDLLFARHLAS